MTTTKTEPASGKVDKVIVVGAGPAGLLLSLLLAKRGIEVHLLEATDKLDEQPRATHYGPAAVAILREAGVLDDVRAEGFAPKAVTWRKLDGSVLASMNAALTRDWGDRAVCLTLDRLGKILYKHLCNEPNAKVHWSTRVTTVGQIKGKAWVEAETKDGLKKFEADYLVGCDGGKSHVRRCIFGNRALPGKTWDIQLVATNVYYDFDRFGWDDVNFIADPEHWFMACRIDKDGQWRVTYSDLPNLTCEELAARQPMKYEKMLPGKPKPGDYKLTNLSPYAIHQRCVTKMRVGRILLAADAAHLCNPMGGLGLTGGIVDVGGLADCLFGIKDGYADESILDRYSEVRRSKFLDVVDVHSTANMERLFGPNPDGLMEVDNFLKLVAKAETDEALSIRLQKMSMGLEYDFKQHYHSAPTIGNGVH